VIEVRSGGASGARSARPRPPAVALIALTAALIGCAGPSRSSSTPSADDSPPEPGRVTITAADDGELIRVTPGAQVELHLDDAGWEVEVEGDAILLVPVASIADTGDARWEVRLERPGRAVIRASAPEGRELTVSLEVVPEK